MTLFLVVTGLPGSGKSSLAHKLAPLLNLPVIDKDDILERLYDTRGTGDAVWRRALSRESDTLFREQAEQSTNGAILVSFWHLPGMPRDSGTPTDWLESLKGTIVNLACECPPALAAQRYQQRRRHPGHLDALKPPEEIKATIESVAACKPLEFNTVIQVDTWQEVNLATLVDHITRHLTALAPQ